MTEHFCDICGKPTKGFERIGTISQTTKHTVKCDSKAKIEVRLSFGFIGHSTGYGGPPDLCSECTLALLEDMVTYVGHTYNRKGR